MSDLAWMRPLLAELCGAKPLTAPLDEHSAAMLFQQDWRPDLDVAQAIRALEAVIQRGYWARLDVCDKGWVIQLANSNDSRFTKFGELLPSLVCLSIAVALGWDDAAAKEPS